MKIIAGMLAVVIAIVLVSGCASSATGDHAEGALHVHYVYKDDYSVGLGCYERVSGFVYNAGNTTAGEVLVNFNLVDAKKGTIRDSKPVFIGSIAPGQSGTFEMTLDGECSEEYRVESSFGG